MDRDRQIYLLLCSLKETLCFIDKKTYNRICAVIDCVIELLEM